MIKNQNFLDEFDKFLPEINKKETKPKLKSPCVSAIDDNFSFLNMFDYPASPCTYSNTPAPEVNIETIHEAMKLLNKPISLGVSSRGCMPKPSSEHIEDVHVPIMHTAKITDDVQTQINNITTNTLMNIPYGSFDHTHYNTAFGYSYDDLVDMRDDKDTICKLKDEIVELKAEILTLTTIKSEALSDTSSFDKVNVRRQLIDLKRNIQAGLAVHIDKPNDSLTHERVRCDITNILSNSSIVDYSVVCDETNNTPSRIDNNKLHVDVTIKPNDAAEFIHIPIHIKSLGVELLNIDEENCEKQLVFDFETEPKQLDTGYFYAPYIPQMTSKVVRDGKWITEDFISSSNPEGRGSLVETLPCGQGLGMLDDLEYFQRKVSDAMRVPESYMERTKLQYEVLKAQLETKPSMIVDKDSDIGKQFIKELRVNKFDDAMELVK